MSIIEITGVAKTYASGHAALHPIDLTVEKGEIFALLGPNGAGKTTLISIVCGTVRTSAGTVMIAGHDAHADYRRARAMVGLVPQEIALDIFSTVRNTVRLSRAMFGKPADADYIERLLRDLSLWEKRDAKVIQLSGGMQRRVMIAKALSHEPEVLFLDEPTAGVDVTLRRDMWALVRRLKDRGTTIVLTTHYLEEAEEMADRVGVIDKGKLILVEEKTGLMARMGKRRLTLTLEHPLDRVPDELGEWPVELADGGGKLVYAFDAAQENRMPALLRRIEQLGLGFTDLDTQRSSLEDVFVDLVGERA